jgi:hypothetical protein
MAAMDERPDTILDERPDAAAAQAEASSATGGGCHAGAA